MSGIIGKLSFESGETLARPSLERMLDACVQRGGRRHSLFVEPGIALGCCSDVDDRVLSSTVGTTEQGTIVAVADARLTNAAHLRAALERRRHQFSGSTDNELVAHAYEEWGVRCFEQFRGPFACAIWDGTERRLIVARDHIGIQPLYFALLHGRGVVFASEVRALLQDPGVDREWHPAAIDAYLALGYVPAPLSAFRRISKLEPAHALIVEGRRLQVIRYWDLPAPSAGVDLHDAASSLDTLLRTALSRDGRDASTLYSGGIASTTLMALAPAAQGTPVTVHLDHDATDLTRSDRAAAVLDRTRELETAPPVTAAIVKDLAARCGEPIADPAVLTQMLVAASARRHGDTAVTGHGASVLWGGRSRPQIERPEDQLWDGRRRRAIYTRDFAWQVRDANPYRRHLELYASHATGDPTDRTLYVDARTFLPDDALAAATRASAASGLTLRFPFLDLPLVELAAALPTSLKVHGDAGMQPIRALLARLLPASLLPPVHPVSHHNWLRAALLALVPSALLSPRFDGRGIVSRLALAHLWDEHRAGGCDHARRLWSLVMLEFWFRQFVDGDAAAEEPYEYALLKAA